MISQSHIIVGFQGIKHVRIALFSVKKLTWLIVKKGKIKQRIQQALGRIDKRRPILAPDCGRGFLLRVLCPQKLKIMKKLLFFYLILI